MVYPIVSLYVYACVSLYVYTCEHSQDTSSAVLPLYNEQIINYINLQTMYFVTRLSYFSCSCSHFPRDLYCHISAVPVPTFLEIYILTTQVCTMNRLNGNKDDY